MQKKNPKNTWLYIKTQYQSQSGQKHIRKHKKNNKSAVISLLNTLGGMQLYVKIYEF